MINYTIDKGVLLFTHTHEHYCVCVDCVNTLQAHNGMFSDDLTQNLMLNKCLLSSAEIVRSVKH